MNEKLFHLLVILAIAAGLPLTVTAGQPSDDILQLTAIHETLKEDIKSCADTTDRVGRLLCFDKLSESLGIITKKQRKDDELVLATYGFWDVLRKTNDVGEVHTYLKIKSNKPVKSRSGTIKTPELVVKCRTNDTEVYLDWKTPLRSVTANYSRESKYLYVVHSFDNEARPGIEWELSLDKYAAFVPDPIGFVRDMKGKRIMALQLTPEGDANQTVVFTLDGFDKALNHVIQDCYN